MRSSRFGILAVLLAACSQTTDRPPADSGRDASDAGGLVIDHDGDGLCDTTEAELGSDPTQRDTDADGLPDLIELGNGFDATDSAQPTADQIAYLLAKPGSTLDFSVRVTIDGKGEGVIGTFQPMGSFYTDSSTAQDFFREAKALAADPVDGVRSIDADAARFRSVLGRTRLEFGLRFVYSDSDELSCARAYPFSYLLESDSGEVLSDAVFLLIVSPDSAESTGVGDYCVPHACQ